MKAKASPTALAVSTDSGSSSSRTSASTTDRMTDLPGKASPIAVRTALRIPSVPTT